MEDNVQAKAPRKRTPKAVDKPAPWVKPELPSLTELKLEAQQEVKRPRTHAEILASFHITGDVS